MLPQGLWVAHASRAQLAAALEQAVGRKGLRLIHCVTDIEQLSAGGLTVSGLRSRGGSAALGRALEAAVRAGDLAKLAMLAVPLRIRVAYEALSWGRHVNEFPQAWEIVEREICPKEIATHPAGRTSTATN